jgi:hypothetical protein
LTVTILGIVLANQNQVSIKHIVEFKENLRVILISTLFIVLASRLKIDDFANLDLNSFIFLAILIFIARPLSVFISTIGQNLNLREKLFLSWLAPRGIVAAAVASIFALELSAFGYVASERLIPLTFFVIIATVALYGLSSGLFARVLNLSEYNPQGLLIVGAHAWARQLGSIIRQQGFRVLLVDSNYENVYAARAIGIEAVGANILTEDVIDQLDLRGIGRLFAITTNDEVNALATLHFKDIFGRAEVYQLPYKKKKLSEKQHISLDLRGRRLFDQEITFENLNEYAAIKVMEIADDDFQPDTENILPLILIDTQNNLTIYTDQQKPRLAAGMRLIYQTKN